MNSLAARALVGAVLASSALAQVTGRGLSHPDHPLGGGPTHHVALLGNDAMAAATIGGDPTVRHFRRSAWNGAWIEQQALVIPSGPGEGWFLTGVRALGFTEHWAAVTAPWDQRVYVYRRTSPSWSLVQVLEDPASPDQRLFARELDLEGERLIVGATSDVFQQVVGSAHVYRYSPSSGSWVEETRLQSTLADPFAFGGRVTLGADHAVVAGKVAATDEVGLFTFERNSAGDWVEVDLISLGQTFLRSLELFEDRLLVGTLEGAFLYERDPVSGVWVLVQHWPQGSSTATLADGRVYLGDSDVILEQVEVAPGVWQPGREFHPQANKLPAGGFGRSVAADERRVLISNAAHGQQEGAMAYAFRHDTDEVGLVTCPGAANSTGVGGTLQIWGSGQLGDHDVVLRAEDLPLGKYGTFLAARTPGFVPNPGGSQGNLCLGADLGRFGGLQLTGELGRMTLELDLTALPSATGDVAAQVGETWYFQAWYRDQNPGWTSNFTDASAVTLQ